MDTVLLCAKRSHVPGLSALLSLSGTVLVAAVLCVQEPEASIKLIRCLSHQCLLVMVVGNAASIAPRVVALSGFPVRASRRALKPLDIRNGRFKRLFDLYI